MLVFNLDAIADVVARLQADVNTWVDTYNGARGTTLSHIDTTSAILDYMPPLREIRLFPTIAVVEGPDDLVDDVGYGATGLSMISVVVIHQHAEASELAHQLRGYKVAVGNAVLALRQLSHVWGVVYKGSVPGPTLSAPNPESVKEWMSLTGLAFELRDEQS